LINVTLFLIYFIYCTKDLFSWFFLNLNNFDDSHSLLFDSKLLVVSYFNLIVTSFFITNGLISKVIFLILFFKFISFMIIEWINFLLDYVHSNLFWFFCSYLIITIGFMLYLKVFFFIFFI